MNGNRTWKPASRTAWNFPSRSTTKAFCCGTTTAVLTTTKTAKIARTIAMTSAALTESMCSSGKATRPLLAAHEQREPLDPLDPAALPLSEREPGRGARAPRDAAELRLRLAARGEVAEERHLLA